MSNSRLPLQLFKKIFTFGHFSAYREGTEEEALPAKSCEEDG